MANYSCQGAFTHSIGRWGEIQVRALNVMPGGGHLGVDTVCFSEGDRGGHHMSQLIVGPYT